MKIIFSYPVIVVQNDCLAYFWGMQMTVDKELYGKNVVIAPLNWGLGHATRCIPIIRRAIEVSNKVIIASDGNALAVLKGYFPQVKFIDLPSYKVTYRYKSMILNGLISMPNALSAIKSERNEIAKLVEEESIDVIISDNRYGCRDARCISIFISHQLDIPFSNSLVKSILNYQNKAWVSKFDQVWVPDYPDNKLSGSLSNQQIHPIIKYIGPQSIHKAMKVDKYIDILVLLSGPEPQRSYLEASLVDCLKAIPDLSITLISGMIGKVLPVGPSIDHKDYVSGANLTQLLNQSRLIICRSGYSTIMDIHKMDMKAIFIATPGQTEQEYLADYHSSLNPNYKVLDQANVSKELAKTIDDLLAP